MKKIRAKILVEVDLDYVAADLFYDPEDWVDFIRTAMIAVKLAVGGRHYNPEVRVLGTSEEDWMVVIDSKEEK